MPRYSLWRVTVGPRFAPDRSVLALYERDKARHGDRCAIEFIDLRNETNSVADVSVFSVQNSAFEKIDAQELALGMYVTELDRPWLGTPFLMQGLLIEEPTQIDVLRQICQTVLVDRRRSIGDQYAERTRVRETPRLAASAVSQPSFVESSAVPGDGEFLSVVRRVRERNASPSVRRVRPSANESRLETELLYSAPIIDDVHQTLDAIRQAINVDGGLDMSRVSGLVEEMAACVQRNPDAMLWLTRLKKSDQYSYDHAVDVSVHLMVFARFLGLGSATIEDLGRAGLMQDVGKAQLDPEILAKPSVLSEEEYLEVQTHVDSSLDILRSQNAFSDNVLSIVAAHHERYDGSGYPRRLDGKGLTLPGELAGLIDTYCAMIRQRVYSSAVSSQKALEVLARLRGVKFREALVDQFIQCIGLYPIGTLVELNTGEVAVVIQQNQVRRLKPRVLVLLAPDKTLERRPRSLELILEPMTPTGEHYRIKSALPSNAYGIDPDEFFLNS